MSRQTPASSSVSRALRLRYEQSGKRCARPLSFPPMHRVAHGNSATLSMDSCHSTRRLAAAQKLLRYRHPVATIEGGIAMRKSIHMNLIRLRRAILLWGCGWKRRRFITCSRPVIEWQDPMSGMWLHEDAALRVALVQARRSNDRREQP